MPRQLLPLALLALPLFFTHTQAQDTAPRVVELRIVAMSRAYMRPMKSTAERIAKVEGIESCEMLGFGGDTARFSVTTKLDDKALASALQLSILGRGEEFLTLSNADNNRAKRAEARGILTQIALAISNQPKPSWDNTSEPLFQDSDTVKDRMRRLDLNPSLLGGTFYKPADYHIEEQWDGNSGTYKIWAGDSWEGVYVPADDWWYEGEEEDAGAQPDLDSRFVGIRVYRSPWSNSMTWVDSEGLSLDGYAGDRGETDSDGVLHVQHGATWLRDIMSAVVAILVREPKRSIDRMPSGRGWNIFGEFDGDNPKIDRWDLEHYDRDNLNLKWRQEDGRKYANLRAHHQAHPFYLELDVDATGVVEGYKKRAADEDLELKTVQEADLDGHLNWICGAEESAQVFREREREAAENFDLIRKALTEAIKTHVLGELCGNLGDEELLTRLGIELSGEHFAPGDYTLRAQMLGDVEISVGNVRTGGRNWTLVNAAGGNVIRSNR